MHPQPFYQFYYRNLGNLSEAASKLFWAGDYRSCYEILNSAIAMVGISNLGMHDLLVWHYCGHRLGVGVWPSGFSLPSPPSPEQAENLYHYELALESSGADLGHEDQHKQSILSQPKFLSKALLACHFGIATQCRGVIETGTYLGSSSYVFSGVFQSVDTIEADPLLHESSKKWLGETTKNVSCHLGNSALVLARLLNQRREKHLIFLDAHYSFGPTSNEYGACPLVDELKVLMSSAHPSTIVIDDCRCMGTPGYPSLEEIFSLIPKGRSCQISFDQLIIY
jgi:hypothetical protein